MSDQPHLARVEAVRLTGDTPRERGRARGSLLRDRIRSTAQGYAELFADLAIAETDQREASAGSIDALRAWSPARHEELTGVAEAAGLDLVDLGRTIARTEILTLAPNPPEECSALAHRVPGRTVSAQTWDWYSRMTGCWHAHRVEALPGELAYAGLTEHGMPGKIGLNAAGVGVHLNILKHRDDGPGGVPVHGVLARLLAEATSVADGIAIIADAPTTSSSVITLVEADRVAMVEIAPDGTSVLEQDEGWLLHTNHFLADDRQDGALLLEPTSTSRERLAHLGVSTGQAGAPTSAADLLALLCSPLEDHLVALLPDPTRPEAERTATLVTVWIDPAARTIGLSPGVPQLADEVSLTYRL